MINISAISLMSVLILGRADIYIVYNFIFTFRHTDFCGFGMLEYFPYILVLISNSALKMCNIQIYNIKICNILDPFFGAIFIY